MSDTHSAHLLRLPPLNLNSHRELEQLFCELANDFQKSENNVLVVKDQLNILPIPAINQLRYAGYHLAQALSSSSISNSPISIHHGHIIAVHKHCLRAYYDAFDMAVIVVKEQFEDISMKYRNARLSIYGEFPESVTLRNEIYDLTNIKKLESEDFLEETVQTKEKREDYYRILNDKLKFVFKLYKQKAVMEDHLVVKINEQIAKRRSHRITFFLSILAIIVTVASVAYEDKIKAFATGDILESNKIQSVEQTK